MEALTPPAQLSEWHMLAIKSFRTVQAVLDLQPKDDVIGFADFILIAAAAGDLEEKLDEVSARLPEDIRRQMIEVGCIDPEDVPDDREDATDDHGNDIDDATVAAVGADVEGVIDYQGDSDYFRFTAEEGQFYQVDVALGSLPDSVLTLLGPDRWELAYNDDHGDSLASRVVWEAPESGDYYLVVEAAGFDAGSYTLTISHSTIVDDHGNDIDDATVAAVGADVEGVIDYQGDSDYFRFTVEEGQFYQVDVALGTLRDSVLMLLGPDRWELAYNDDHGDSLASRVVWEAPASGEYYLAVASAGFDAGSYTLTVSHSTIVDDHGNDIDDATVAAVGADVEGAVDYEGDIDYFRFQAERGQSYQIDVALGTLDDSIVDLYDVGWSFLDTNDDYGDTYASRLYWEAPRNGVYYVAVTGYGTGTYTLTVSLVDDHGDTAEDGGSVASDRAVLVALYNATEGGSWTTRTNWLSGRPLDEWHGVTTDSDGRVTALNLSSNSLYGALPAALGDLTNLESLVLSNNELTGPIPAWLGDLSNLRALNLWSNELTGPIPAALGDLTNLESLWLGWNELTGPIPAWLGDLSNLVELVLQVNELTGPIPAELGDLSNLQWLDLSFNYLTGPIPAELGDLSNLEFLDLGTNRLTGPIPAELSNLSNLSELQLLGNQLTGCVPVGLRDVAEENDLGELDLPDCGLEGRPTASSFVSVSTGRNHNCGVRSGGSVACWGSDEYGQATPPAGSFVSVSAGVGHTCGVRSNGSVACWGWYRGGQTTPPAGSFVSVSAGEAHTCGVRSGGSVACWGSNGFGQATPPAGSFISVSAGGGHNCGVRNNGSVACWGSDEYGRATPPAGSFVSVSAGALHSCGVRSNGSVACWGYNKFGQATPPASSFVSVNVGAFHTCGVRSNGSVACWGSDVFGQATPPAGSFVSVSAGVLHTCGVRIGGSVACWGSDEYGQATPPAPTATAPPATPTAATNIAPTPKPFPERTHVILRVVQVTEDWVPFSDASGWTQAVLQKESDVLRYYEAAIWEETDSVHLYAFPNDYDGLFGLRRENVPDADVIAYREQHAISVHSDMPEAWGDRRSDFLRIAFEDFVSRLVERHPEADHHLMYSGHGGPGGALFAGQLKHDDADVFLATWTRLLGKPLGVIDMGGPCNKGAYEDLANFCRHASYYVASDLPNGGYSEDEWTSEKHHETDPETQYHRLLASNETLEEALIERVELRRKKYEYSMNNQIRNQVEQANYVYSCARFNDFSEAFESFVDGTTIQAPADDLYQLMLDYSAPPALLDRFRDVFVHGVDNRDFFEWKVTANGMLSPSGG